MQNLEIEHYEYLMEQAQKIDTLEQEISNLRSEISDLSWRLMQLEDK